MKNHKFSLNKLLSNNKFLFLLALLISLVIWIYMSTGSSNDTTITISNIPIQIELSDEADTNGLRIFSGSDQTASVSVSGNRAVLGSISEKDITVTAATNGIASSGNYPLSVSAIKTNPSANFQIVSTVTPSTVNVLVDYYRESKFQIQESVVYKVEDGYYASISLSSKEIKISGPQTKIAKIAKVSAVAEIQNKINATTSTEAKLVLYDDNNHEISTDLLTMEFTTVQATVTALPEKMVMIKPVFINKPDGLEITDDIIKIEPESIYIAGTQDILDDTSYVYLESIDFSTLTNKSVTFESLGIDIPTDCKNISNTSSAKVTLDLSKMKTKTVEVNTFNVAGLSDEYNAKVTQKSINITVIGPEDKIKKINSDNIIGVINTSDLQGTTGSVQMPLTFEFNSINSCWVYGNYKANITITEK